MSLIGTTATVQITSVIRAFETIKKFDIKKAFLELRGPANYDQGKHLRETQGPDGRWPGLAASTLERRSRKRGRSKGGKRRSWPKTLLGRFPKALQSVATSRELVVKSRVKRFSWIHQEGGGPAGHGSMMPRRQYLWISKWLLTQTKLTFERALAIAAKGP